MAQPRPHRWWRRRNLARCIHGTHGEKETHQTPRVHEQPPMVLRHLTASRRIFRNRRRRPPIRQRTLGHRHGPLLHHSPQNSPHLRSTSNKIFQNSSTSQTPLGKQKRRPLLPTRSRIELNPNRQRHRRRKTCQRLILACLSTTLRPKSHRPNPPLARSAPRPWNQALCGRCDS